MRMQSESRAGWEAATKHMPTQKDMRTIWSILAIFCGVFFALSLSTTVLEVLAKSPHSLDWATWTATFSIWLSVAVYARSQKYYEKYYEANLQRWIKSHRKSRAERIRAAFVFAGGCCGPVRSRLWRPDSRGHGARAWPIVGSIPRSSDSDSPS